MFAQNPPVPTRPGVTFPPYPAQSPPASQTHHSQPVEAAVRLVPRARVRVANGPAQGLSVTVPADADGYPPTDALIAVVDRQAVARRPGTHPPGSHVQWTQYTAQQRGPGVWEYVAEGCSRV
jgi:hypothetical protein